MKKKPTEQRVAENLAKDFLAIVKEHGEEFAFAELQVKYPDLLKTKKDIKNLQTKESAFALATQYIRSANLTLEEWEELEKLDEK